jgi:hypothetical protein
MDDTLLNQKRARARVCALDEVAAAAAAAAAVHFWQWIYG